MSRFTCYERISLVSLLVAYFALCYMIFYRLSLRFEDYATTPSWSPSQPGQPSTARLFERLTAESEQAPSENLLWFVHVSDIHISHYKIGNGRRNLEALLRDVLPSIEPAFVVATGDLTESARNILDSQQIEQEWKTYRSLLEQYGALEKKDFWIDIRGNHDAFDIPDISHPTNYFAKYSQTKEYNFTRSFRKDDLEIGIVAFDACPKVGFIRFFNFVGYLELEDLNLLHKNIHKFADTPIVIGIGHYPLSVLQVPAQFPLKQVTSSFSCYLCGHLHRMAGEELQTVHDNGMGEFEVPDLKNPGIFRVVSVDHGLINFHDFRVDQDYYLMIANPKNAQFYLGRENADFIQQSSNIRILLFTKNSAKKIEFKIKVLIDGKEVGFASQSLDNTKLWLLPWNPKQISNGLHEISALLIDEHGALLAKDSFGFSVDGTKAPLAWNILHAPFGLLLKCIVIAIQLILLVSLVVSSFLPLSIWKYSLKIPFDIHILTFHKPVFYATIGYIISHLVIPYHIGKFVSTSPIIYFNYFFGLFDSQGNYFPVLDTYIWYAAHMASIFVPALWITCQALQPHKTCLWIVCLKVCWLIYCIGYFGFDCYYCSLLALLSTRFLILLFFSSYALFHNIVKLNNTKPTKNA